MKQYSFLEEMSTATKLAIGAAGGLGLGAIGGNIVARANYKKPDDEMLISNHEASKVPLTDKIRGVEAEINQLISFRNRLENGEYDIDVPIQKINTKIYAKQQYLLKLKKKLSVLTYKTTQDLRDAHKKSYVRKGTLIGGATGAAVGTGVGALA